MTTYHAIRYGGIHQASPAFDEVFYRTNYDDTTVKHCVVCLETPPYNQRPPTVNCVAAPAAVPVSPCHSNASSASAAAAARSTITGKFRNVEDKYYVDARVLGSGHHGSVRECFDRATGRRYAVKSVRKGDPAVKPGALAREVTLLRGMNHRSIVQLVDVFEDAEHLHLMTDLCEGGELFDRIVKYSSLDNGASCFPEDEAARIMGQIVTSVSYMHGLGIAHRDIKPENILFETSHEDSPIKIIDFGLSRMHLEGVEPPMDTIVGTPYYVAPEVLKRKYGKSCDLWSVGVIAYILLCGYPPFSGNDDHETHRAVLDGRYCFPTEDWKGVSFEARHFVSCLLQIDTRRRMTAEQALSHPWMIRYSDRLVGAEPRDYTAVKHAYCVGTRRSTTMAMKKYEKLYFGSGTASPWTIGTAQAQRDGTSCACFCDWTRGST